MTRRRKILIAVIVLVLLALAVWLFLTRPPRAAPVTAPTTTTESSAPAAEEGAQVALSQLGALNPSPAPVAERRPGYLQVSELFAERYGSYSNQESYANLSDLLPLMTDAYRARTERLLAEEGGRAPAASYEGVTSVKISTKQIAYNDSAGTATIDVNLQQTKTTGTSEPQVSYKILRVVLERLGEDWKVDSAAWR